MTEQMSFHFPEKPADVPVTQPSSPTEHPEPLTRADRETLTQTLKLIKRCRRKLEEVEKALSTQRLKSTIKATKGGEFFDGSQFMKEKQTPVKSLLDRVKKIDEALSALLESDPPPSFQKKHGVMLDVIDLVEELKRWEATS